MSAAVDKLQFRLICNALRHRVKIARISDLYGVSRSFVSRITKDKIIRILLEADYHTGHVVGLTPPQFQLQVIEDAPEFSQHNKWARITNDIWSWRQQILESLKPIDVHMFLGDAVDGTGIRSGGTELLTTDRTKQVNMSLPAFNMVEAPIKHMVFGTPYHTGEAEDFENLIAEKIHANIGSHDWYEYNNCVFDIKHFQTNPKNPHTSLLNEVKANREWADLGEQPFANVIVRAHTHRWALARGEGYVAISLPALQGYGSKYGARKMKNKVSVGLVCIDVWPDGYPVVTPYIAKLHNLFTRVDNVI